MKRKRRITKSQYDLFVKKFERMLHDCARKSVTFGMGYDEKINIGYEQLLYVMIHFDIKRYPQFDKGTFTSFLFHRIRGTTQHQVKNIMKHSVVQPMSKEQLDNCKPTTTDLDLPILVEELLNILNPTDRILMESIMQGKSRRQIGIEIGVTRNFAHSRTKRVLAKLKKVIET